MIKNVISRISRYDSIEKILKNFWFWNWNKSFEEATRFFFKKKKKGLLLIIVDCYKYCCNIEIEIENFNQIFVILFQTFILHTIKNI